ncbi:MAG TPA: DUF5652 family protein [Candidatus Bathyarchaeia archaeon]|nr:DUF5652 family protein [Candidatus Bathyarchaeia archaeon]
MHAETANFIQAHLWIIAIVVIWTFPWKGVALWRAARDQSVVWFVVLFVVNTLGILEILYILFFSKGKPAPQEIEQQIEPEKEIVREKKVVDIKIEEKTDLDEPAPKS